VLSSNLHPPVPGDSRFLAPDLDAERRRLARSLRRTGLVTALLLAVVGALAILVVHHASQSDERLWEAQLNQARSARFSGRPGARALALEAIRAAARDRVSPELRDEAIAALALDDLTEGAFTNILSGRDASFAVNTGLNLLAVAEEDGSVRLRPLFGPGTEHRLPTPGEPVHYLFFSPDTRWLVARHASGFTRAWSIADRRPGIALHDTARRTTSRGTVRFLPDRPSQCWLADQAGHQLRLLDLEANTQVAALPLDGIPGVLALAPDGRIAVAIGSEAQIWNPATHRLEQRIRMDGAISALEWQPDGSQLALGSESGSMELVDPPNGTQRRLVGHRALIHGLRFTPDGRKLLSTSWDGTTRFWDAALAQPLLVTRDGLALHFDRDGARLAFYRGNTGIGFWKLDPSPVLDTLAAPPGSEHHFTDIAASPDSRFVAGVNRQDLVVWDLDAHRLIARQSLAGSEGVAWSPEGGRLVTASAEGLTRWTFAPGNRSKAARLEKVHEMGRAPVNGRFHRVSESLIAASGDDDAWLVRPWETNAPQRISHGTVTTFAHVTCDPTGQMVVASLWKGGGTWVRDLRLETEPTELEPLGGFARFAPDGRTLLTGNNRGYQLWEVGTFRERSRLDHQLSSDFPGLGLFAPDGEYAFVVHGHRRIARVGLPELRPEAVFEAPGEANLYALAQDSNARLLLAGTDDSRVFVWRLAALDRSLHELGIPSVGSPRDGPRNRWIVPPLGWVLVAFVGAAVLALHTLWRQRGLVGDYLHIETLMAERNRQLLQAREELLHGHKMQALGQITAGVAHDLRNLLSVISLSNGLIRRGVAATPELAEEANAVEKAVERGRSLVLALLGYSRRSDESVEPTDAAAVVEDLLRLLGRKFFSGIQLELSIAGNLPHVAVRGAQLEQLLLNLLVNASDAMGGSGTLRVEGSIAALPSGADWLIAHASSSTSGVLLRIIDCGPGIPPDAMPRIFEPFFTTKARSSTAGTGLGLSTVFAIAHGENLGLAVRSRPGATEFALLLPVQP
jgi:signal transduction histidine kinase